MEDIKFEKIPSGIFDKLKTNKEEFVERFIDDLEELFPDTVKDGKVDFQALLERFGEYQDNDERYELTWIGKNKARQESFEDIVGRTLKYIEEDSKNPDTTENLYIEGDNLEVLKLLRKSYYGKIKMIYIDPPYNRRKGDDLIYRDDFTLTKEEYDKLKGDVDEYGERLVKNNSDSGRYHSNWLNMIYPRLQVARDLLTDDGVIFISIDDNEQSNLNKVCEEIFGIKNIETIVWKKMDSKVDRNTNAKIINRFKNIHEYIIVCYKNKEDTFFNKIMRLPDWKQEQRNIDNDPRGNWQSGIISYEEGHKNEDRESEYYYSIQSPSGKITTRHWFITKKEFETLDKDNRIYYPRNGEGIPRLKTFENEEKEYFFESINEGMGTSSSAKDEIENILNNRNIFDTPKPVKLIKELIRMSNGKDDLILDFFSGSATTAHAVMDLNAEDGGNRKFIMVQLPEPTDEKSTAYKEGYKNICEIGKERIRRAGDKILEENKDEDGIENLDTGFKVFRVEDTNFKRILDTSLDADITEIKYKNIKDSEDFNPHFTDLDVVYELMLRRQDIELTEEVKKLDSIGDRTYIVGDTMLVCLEENITEEIVEKIGGIDTDLSWIVLRDSAFDDNCELKINTTRKLRSIIKSSREKDQKIYWI